MRPATDGMLDIWSVKNKHFSNFSQVAMYESSRTARILTVPSPASMPGTLAVNPGLAPVYSFLMRLALLVILAAVITARAQDTSPLTDSSQLLVVTTDGWDGIHGVLQRYERRTSTSEWQPAGPPVSVVVGRNGMAWGSGLGDATEHPLKREGDGKSPAGIFPLGSAFGQAPDSPDLRLPYLFLGTTDGVECVDDTASRFYNRLVSRRDVQPDWRSSEKMWTEPLYRHGVVIDYNTPNPRPGAGSCIFLHIWAGADIPTSGCTAMPEAELLTVMRWLDPAQHPVLVQLPRAQYGRLKTDWRLPSLPTGR